eukprot:1190159-Prorocentrum_minimum.AAC.2
MSVVEALWACLRWTELPLPGALVTWYPARLITRYRKAPDGQWGYFTSVNDNLPGAPPIPPSFIEETFEAYKLEIPDLNQEGRVVGFGNVPGALPSL